PQAY
ncbi:hypothetical protein EC5905_3218, partial [Escherichia coli 5905]